MAATIPGQPDQPHTIIVDTDVLISWNAPASSGGDNVPITSYSVEILINSGEYIQACEVSELQCSITMDDLLEKPYLFVQGDQVQAIVTARNI
jgi:hypothetical protein